MFCSNCGSKLPEGAKFCSECGARVLEAVKVDDTESAPLDFSDLPGADAESKPAEAPVKTRVTFDWSNVIDEPQKRTVQDIKSPWSTTGSVDEAKVYEEIKPSTDRSRTMSFIDVLKAEKEQAEAVKSIEETLAEDTKDEERPIIYTEVLDPGYLDELGVEENAPKIPELHIAPLYEDLDQPVVTPFDDVEEEVPEEPVAEEPTFEEPKVEDFFEEEPVAEEPVVEEPVFEEPVVEKPVSEEPEVEEPVFEEPEVEEPVFEEPEVEEPVFEEPEAEEPVFEEPEAEEPVFEEPEAEEPVFEEPEVEEPAEVEPENKPWFDLPDFLKPREDTIPFAPAEEVVLEQTIEEPVFDAPIGEEPVAEEPVEEPEAEEPAVEDVYLDIPEVEEEPEIEDFLNEPEFEEPEFEELEIEEPEFEEPVVEEPEFEEPVVEEPEFEEPVVEEPEFEEPVVEEPEFEEPVVEEPEFEEPVVEEPVFEEPVVEEPAAEEDFDLFGNTEDEYLDISTERGTVTRATMSFDPDEFDDEDDEEEDEEDDEPVAEEPAEEAPVDEEVLFAEMEEETPKKTGMTIAAPADKESEIEALKKRLAELMGTDWEEPQAIEKEDKLELEDLVAEPEEQDYYFKDGEPAEEPASHDFEYEKYDKADLTQYDTPAEEVTYEDEYLNIADEAFVAEEPAVEVEEPVVEAEEPELEIPEVEVEEPVVEVEEPELEIPEVEVEEPVVEVEEPELEIPEVEAEEPAVEVEEPVAEEPVIEIEEPVVEEKEDSIEDYLAAILEQEAAPAVEPKLDAIENSYLDEEVAAEPAVEVEEPAIEIPAVEVEEPVVEAEEPTVDLGDIAVEPEVEAPAKKESDALTIEELEKDLFGESSIGEAQAAETKKIDKFYTLYRKNEEFQRLLNEEYEKLKTGDPAPEQALPDPEPPASAAKEGKQIEDATIYQEFEIPPEALAEAEAKAAEARENAPVKFEKDTSADDNKANVGAAIAGAAVAGGAAIAGGAAATGGDTPEVEYEEVDKGGGCLTVLAVIIAILLVILLGIILLLNFAPDSAISIKIDSIIENITSHFTVIEVLGKQILL